MFCLNGSVRAIWYLLKDLMKLIQLPNGDLTNPRSIDSVKQLTDGRVVLIDKNNKPMAVLSFGGPVQSQRFIEQILSVINSKQVTQPKWEVAEQEA